MATKQPSAVVTSAAEALARAALDEAVSATNAMSQDGVIELKHIHGSVDKLVTSSKTSGEAIFAAISRLKDEVSSVRGLLKNMNDNEIASAKCRSLQFGIANAKFGSFNYRKDHGITSSEEMVVAILMSFMRGCGHYVEGHISGPHNAYHRDEKEKEADKTKFRTQLADQIHGLIGKKPSFTKQEDGRYVIWY